MKLKAKSEIVFSKDAKDIKGWVIPAGTTLFVMNDSAPAHPREGYKIVVVRIDNGTGVLDLCPETAVRIKGGLPYDTV